MSLAWASEQKEHQEALLKDKRKTNKLSKTDHLFHVDEILRKIRTVTDSCCHLNRNDPQGRAKRKQRPGNVEFLEEEEIKKDEPTSETDASDVMPALGLVPSYYSKNKTEKEQIKKQRQQKTASAVVTGGALTLRFLPQSWSQPLFLCLQSLRRFLVN